MSERSLLDYVQSNVGGRWVIAGGYVRDRILGREPRDIDMFLLSEMSVEDSMAMIKLRLNGKSIPYTVERKGYGFNEDCISRFGDRVQISWLGRTVELITTPLKHPVEVVATFDFNICRFYLDEALQAVPFKHDDLGDLLARNMRLMHDRTPVSSLKRGFLFEHRLGMKFQPTDIRTLVEKLALEGIYDV